MHNVADVVPDLKYGIAKWNSVLQEVLVQHEMCDMVRNGVTWNVPVWLRMSEVFCLMWNDAM